MDPTKILTPIFALRRSCRRPNSSTTSKLEEVISCPIDYKLESYLTGDLIDSKLYRKTADTETTWTSTGRHDAEITKQEKSSPSTEGNKPDGYLRIDHENLDLERTLMGGQSFRWIKSITGESTLFTGVVGNQALQLWRCDNEQIAFRKLNEEGHNGKNLEFLLVEYFQLNYCLKDLYEEWSKRDKHFRECSKQYTGFRILRQDPVENVFSFICATNNNIKRISQMIDKLCRRFGVPLIPSRLHSLSTDDKNFWTFPTVERLAQEDVFDCLRYELGFGYRAKFICETAKLVMSQSQNLQMSPEKYLMSLRQLTYPDTRKKLQSFPGIGRKVADCICLMSMDHLQSVPIDCHIYDIVCRNYMPKLREQRKTLTDAVHDLISDYFNILHGPLAGWATSVLFIAELKHLKKPADTSSSAPSTAESSQQSKEIKQDSSAASKEESDGVVERLVKKAKLEPENPTTTCSRFELKFHSITNHEFRRGILYFGVMTYENRPLAHMYPADVVDVAANSEILKAYMKGLNSRRLKPLLESRPSLNSLLI